jgi:hypothetical protein
MAVNFGLLNTSDVGAQFRAGMQDAENALARRQERDLRAQEVESLKQRRQAEAMESEAKARAAEGEVQARRQRQEKLTQLLTQNGHRPSRELYATMAQDPDTRIQAIAFQALKDMDLQEQEQAELERLGLRGAPAPAAPMAPAAAEPMGAPAAAAPTNALAPAPAAPVNAMAAPAGITREMIQQMMLSPNANVRARGKALMESLPKERTSQLLTPEEEAQKTRIALASRPPKSSGGGRSGGDGDNTVAESGKGVGTYRDESGNLVTVTHADAVRRKLIKASEDAQLPPKEIQKREALFPKAKQAVQTVEASMDTLEKDLTTLANHPGLNGITGVIYGRTPSVTKDSLAAQALYDKIVARGGFSELQAMRAASPTGGALGNVSNQEGQQLKQAFAEIGQVQSTDDMKKALLRAAETARQTKQRAREAYDDTYSYRSSGQPAGGDAPPPMSAEDKQALDWANANPKDPRAAAIKQRLGVR